jgi:succinyl-CoA synthetase beta subunit
MFVQYGLTLAEINPLAKLADGRFVCLDGHVDMEDDARDQHKALLQELGIAPDEKRRRGRRHGSRSRARRWTRWIIAAWPATSSSSTATSAW